MPNNEKGGPGIIGKIEPKTPNSNNKKDIVTINNSILSTKLKKLNVIIVKI